MEDLVPFEKAVQRLQDALAKQGYPTAVSWVFRDDLCLSGQDRALVGFPLPASNSFLARKVYGEGCSSGLVELTAVARCRDIVCATVWFPQCHGWPRGLRVSIREPLPAAHLVPPPLWWLLGFTPRFRHFQAHCSLIGTRSWAASYKHHSPR